MGSLGRDGQLHHSCSTFGLGCSHLFRLELFKQVEEATYGTCGHNHHMSSRFAHLGLVRHRIHLDHHRIRPGHRHIHLGRHHIHQHLHQGSYGRCGQPYHTVKNVRRNSIKGKLEILPCSTPGSHQRCIHHHRHHVQHPQQRGWRSHGRCGQVDRICSKSYPLDPRGIHGLIIVSRAPINFGRRNRTHVSFA